jgi:hypothetical protein
VRRGRLRWAPPALLAVALVTSGCDLMVATVSPEPSRLSRTPEPFPTEEPEATDQVPTPRPAGSGPDLVDAANALANLDSYRVAVTSTGLVPSTGADGLVRMSSTLVQSVEPAVRFSIAGLDGIPGGSLEAIVIGDLGWVRDAGGHWTKSPGGAADFDAAFTALSPMDLATEFDGLAAGLQAAGSERKNGIAASRYHIDSSSAVATGAGLTSGAADVWIATHGGYLVAFSVAGDWDVDGDGTATPVTLRIDITRVNDRANTVQAPA